MGWLKKWITGVAGSPALDLTFVELVATPPGVIPNIDKAIVEDQCYIELYLESLRLAKDRKFATHFHGIVYSFVAMSREGAETAHLAAISKPDKLAALDKGSLHKVIAVSKQMLGATAYRGGAVSIELGLFSVKSGNLLTPILDYVSKVSSAAGISHVGAIKPFLPLITEGMDLIAGQKNDTALEVGVDTGIELSNGCVMAIIDRPKDTVDIEAISLDKDHKLLLDNKPLDCGYAVFSIRVVDQKSDYGEIPELRNRYAALQSAISKGKKKEAQDALNAFRLATIASPDLIPSDAARLAVKARQKYDVAFPQGGNASVGDVHEVEELSKIGLYD